LGNPKGLAKTERAKNIDITYYNILKDETLCNRFLRPMMNLNNNIILANQAFGDELFNGSRFKIRKRNRHCHQSLGEARLEPSTSCDLAGGKSLQNQHSTPFKTLKAGARRGGLAPPRNWEKAV